MSLLRPDLQDIPPYVRPASEAAARGKARLHMNEAAADWPPQAREALLARLATLPFRCYPERQAELTERLRKRLGAPEGGLVMGPSSGALLDLAALACLSPGDAVACPDPGFSLYRLIVARHRGRLRQVPVGTGFPLEPWFEALEAGARQLWITLPNNPTGAWLSPAELEPLLAAAARRPDPPLVVIDEAYAEFAPLTHRLSVDRYPNVLLLRTFSKALACAGWRLGYLLGSPELASRLAALQLPYAIPSPSLEALDVALDFAGCFDREVRAIVDRRERFSGGLGNHEAPASSANFLYVAPDPAPAMAEAGLLARSFSGGDVARVSIGSEDEVRRASEALGGSLAPGGERSRR
ncbi:MAG TPA: aminotransferase class I/II-fold pyridoxal phosphate-dependent enzyme, partial [Holophaga sp.]|nr:aminotransferase class I/II-fold pyridoxal phosphate-dependent enzyme [Holophaga sp.]